MSPSGGAIDRLLAKNRRRRIDGLMQQVRSLDARVVGSANHKIRIIAQQLGRLREEIAELDPEYQVATPHLDAHQSKGKKPRKRRKGDKEERLVAEEIGGEVHPNSGATWKRKSDSSVPQVLRVESKETDKKGYRLTLEELMKIEREAEGDEIPVFTILFKKTPDGMPRRYAVMAWRDLKDAD